MKRLLVGGAFSALLLTSCSSIISQSEYAVAINSNPDRANFTISNASGQQVHSGVTPATVNLRSSAGFFRGETYSVVLEKEGYPSKIYSINSSIDGWYWGNILLGGIIGMLIVDPATGAMYNLPNRVDIPFDERVAQSSADEFTITTIDSLSTEQVARLERLQ